MSARSIVYQPPTRNILVSISWMISLVHHSTFVWIKCFYNSERYFMCYLLLLDGTFHNVIIVIFWWYRQYLYHLSSSTVSSSFSQLLPHKKCRTFVLLHIFVFPLPPCIANINYLDFDSSALSCVVNSSSISSSSQLSFRFYEDEELIKKRRIQ